MPHDFNDFINLGVAAVSGGACVEIIKRVFPSKDISMDLQAKKELEVAQEQKDLRQALWDEIERLGAKVQMLENKLSQQSETMHALKSENSVLHAELELLRKRIDSK